MGEKPLDGCCRVGKEAVTEAVDGTPGDNGDNVCTDDPQGSASTKKHPCPDCSFCQWCSDDRCRLCLNRKGCARRKLSLAEQIMLYDSLNKDGADNTSEG